MYRIITFLLSLTCVFPLMAQTFTDHFVDKTLRVDYLFVGNHESQSVSVDELSLLPAWAGRRHHLSQLPLKGNGQLFVRDAASGDTLYATSFSSLFQEWLETPEAKSVTKGFENTFLVPFPKNEVDIEVILCDYHQQVRTRFVHRVNPNDILIRQRGHAHVTPHRMLWEGGAPEACIDVAILAEGYTAEEMDTFYADAAVACEALFAHEPFASMKQCFNVVAVASTSLDSGVSIPRLNAWKRTAFSSHFSTFYSDRYLTTTHVKAIHDALSGIPYEHIIILANTDEYGGGGIYNSYTLTTAHHPLFRPVVVHEFGHSFGGLADEYFYEVDVMNDVYPLDVEPWEQNITTMIDFASKWEHLLPSSTPVPTPVSEAAKHPVGLYEGGGYSFKGIYRPADNCRMRTNDHPGFCPVCQHALRKLIQFYTEE